MRACIAAVSLLHFWPNVDFIIAGKKIIFCYCLFIVHIIGLLENNHQNSKPTADLEMNSVYFGFKLSQKRF